MERLAQLLFLMYFVMSFNLGVCMENVLGLIFIGYHH